MLPSAWYNLNWSPNVVIFYFKEILNIAKNIYVIHQTYFVKYFSKIYIKHFSKAFRNVSRNSSEIYNVIPHWHLSAWFQKYFCKYFNPFLGIISPTVSEIFQTYLWTHFVKHIWNFSRKLPEIQKSCKKYFWNNLM